MAGNWNDFVGFLFTFLGAIENFSSGSPSVVNYELYVAVFEILNVTMKNHFSVIANMVECFVAAWRKWLFSLPYIANQCGLVVSRRGYQMATRLAVVIGLHPEDFGKVAPYMVADYMKFLEEIEPELTEKKLILPGIYALLDICDNHGKAMLFTNMKPSAKEYFRVIFEEYEKFHRYKGFV